MKKISIKKLNNTFRYDSKTGLLWRRHPYHKKEMDTPAGWKSPKGHIIVCVFGTNFKAHRIVWAMQTGRWPTKQVDHKNRNGSDNRWHNLRLASNGQNRSNSKTGRNSRSGFKCVTVTPSNKFVAYFKKKNTRVHLGTFLTPQEAHAAYVTAAAKQYGEFFHAG